MVLDRIPLSRRTFLGGLVAGLGGTTVIGATQPTALPDVLTDEASKHYPTPPETDTLWQPTVTEAHAREAVTLLEDTATEAEQLWQQRETDRHFTGSGGWLDDAQQALTNGNYREALFDARNGMQFAAEDLGRARVELGRVDVQALAERSRDLLDRTEQVREDIKPYPTTDPARDLAWYYEIERAVRAARRLADWEAYEEVLDAVDDPQSSDAASPRPHEIGTITARLFEAELRVRSAERYHDLLAEKLKGTTTDYAAHLKAVGQQFHAEIEQSPDDEEVLAKYVDETEDDTVPPYEFAHSRLVRWCFDAGAHVHIDDQPALLAYEAVELSKGVAGRRAHDFAVDHLVVADGEETFDSGHVLAEKRRAQSTYESTVGSDPSPLLTVQIDRAVEDLQVAKVGFAGSYRRPIWRERLEAYLYALVGRAKLKKYPAVHDTIVEKA